MKKTASIAIGLLGAIMAAAGLMLKGNAPKGVTVLLFLIGSLVALFAIPVYFYYRGKKQNVDTQRIITDLELLRLFEKQPGGLLSPEMVAEKTGLSKGEASSRLSSLSTGGLLSMGTNATGMKAYFELAAPLETVEGIKLSDEPFLTLEDLQQIFVAYDYKVSPHDLMVTTGLPWGLLSREMQHFRKSGIIEVANIVRPGDSFKQYILLEAYHPSDKLDLDSRNKINEEVKQVLYEERFLV